MDDFKEFNIFEATGKLVTYLRGKVRRRRTSFCRKTKDGHHYTGLLWLRYTLTDTELVIRTLSERRVDLRDLRLWARNTPPEICPGRSIRFTLEDGCVTLKYLNLVGSGTHFVMLLGEATGLDLITPFLGTKSPNSEKSSGL